MHSLLRSVAAVMLAAATAATSTDVGKLAFGPQPPVGPDYAVITGPLVTGTNGAYTDQHVSAIDGMVEAVPAAPVGWWTNRVFVRRPRPEGPPG